MKTSMKLKPTPTMKANRATDRAMIHSGELSTEGVVNLAKYREVPKDTRGRRRAMAQSDLETKAMYAHRKAALGSNTFFQMRLYHTAFISFHEKRIGLIEDWLEMCS